MIAQLVTYAASRAAGDAVDGIARRVIWGVVGGLLLLIALVMALIVTYWMLEPEFGAIPTVLGMAATSAIAGLIANAIPAIADRSKRASAVAAAADTGPVTQTVQAVKGEAEAAVDYFGALQVVASAFMFGLGAARQIRRKS